MSEPLVWKDRVALVTGAAGAIGSRICLELDAAGLRLVLVDLNAEALGALAAKLSRPALCIAGDLCDRALLQSLPERLRSECGGCDLLVNNVGIVSTTPFEQAELAQIERELNINLLVPTLLTRLLLPLLSASGQGRVITIASMAAIMPLAESAVYSASKFALRGLMLSLALRKPRTGVHFALVNPSSVDTPMLRYEAVNGGSPLNFLGEPIAPERVAATVRALLQGEDVERCVPASEGWSAKLALLLPNLLPRLVPWFNRSGERGRERYIAAQKLQRPARPA